MARNAWPEDYVQTFIDAMAAEGTLFDELVGALTCLVPYDGRALVPDDIVATADKLREVGAASGHTWLGELAAAIAPPPDCVKDLEKFETAYSAYRAGEALAGVFAPPDEVVAALVAATKAVLKARPRCPAELGRKVKIACTLGIHARIKRTCSRPDPYAADLYHHFWTRLSPVEPWYLAKAVGYNYSLAEWEFGRRGGNFIVADPGLFDELLDFAGATWKAEIAADVARLNLRAHGAS